MLGLRVNSSILTGIGTSSFNCDKRLRESTFPFECLGYSNRTIAVKSHSVGKKRFQLLDRALLLIRNPYENLLSYFNFAHGGGHVGYAKADLFDSECVFILMQRESQ